MIGGSIYEVNPATSISFNTHTAVSHSLGGTEKMRITSCGYVGIGTTTPSGSLHICGSTYFGSRLILERTSGAVGRYSMGVSTANNQFEITDEAQGNCTRLSITSCGYVGIGTCAPNRPLDVRGDAYFYSGNTSYSEGINVFANIGSTSGAGINFHCAPVGTVASATTLKAYLRVNQTGTCMILGTIAAGYDLCAMIVNIANGNVKFACGLTAATIGTNDLTLSNLNYERANYVDGTRGSWLIQEGACDLFIINQMSCKKYKFNLIEIQ